MQPNLQAWLVGAEERDDGGQAALLDHGAFILGGEAQVAQDDRGLLLHRKLRRAQQRHKRRQRTVGAKVDLVRICRRHGQCRVSKGAAICVTY